ncbi:hypothetical protein EV673_0209 [Limnobacter thiooxidans]|uniref:Uncharacterized protein n=1 Tax=Limnobacter thiooxidans TaxID=131080 RepID=A0AA86IZS1_9BURK|nr:hypothetical protein EV673_0209 [Limnobacter thiooxidans]BET26674.1 hypothetical protein RGQ30_21750 [Limnobacter thiooxidans]
MKLTVIGAYLPRPTPERLAAWIRDDVADFVEGIRDLRSRGFAQYWSDDRLHDRAAELPGELEKAISSAALFEVLVEDHTGEFDPYEISEKETTSVAWEPAYLSVDGVESIAQNVSKPREVNRFRVAFYVHDWPEEGELTGPNGPLAHPTFQPVPERLWTLAPYDLLD